MYVHCFLHLYDPNRESVGLQFPEPGTSTSDTKMHAPKNRNSPGTLLEPFAVGLQSIAKLGWYSLHKHQDESRDAGLAM